MMIRKTVESQVENENISSMGQLGLTCDKNATKTTPKNKFFTGLNCWIGVIIGVIIAIKMAGFSETLHENRFWFSNIKEIEREISFRTEQGLYYSYYKNLLNNKQGLIAGILDLTKDNVTEHGRSINIFKRFNIYQEIVLAAIYKLFSLQMEPSLFYTSAIFKLQFLIYSSMYACSWMLGGTWMSGVLTAALFICNFDDATRVHHTVPLREHFSLPFVYAQMAFVTSFLRCNLHYRQVPIICGIIATTFLYILTWQFAQFISLMQVVVILSLAFVNQVNLKKAIMLIAIHGVCLASIYFLQFGNEMILGSLVLSLVPIGIIMLCIQIYVQGTSIMHNVIRTVIQSIATFLMTASLNFFIRKFIIRFQSDEHIMKFIEAKLGFEDPRDFESQLYLCIDAFKPLEMDTYKRLTENLLLPFYMIFMFINLAMLVYHILEGWDSGVSNEFPARSAIYYNTVHSAVFAMVAASTTRMICFWVPHACIVTSVAITNSFILNALSRWTNMNVKVLRQVAAVAFLAVLTYKIYPILQERLSELHEFWDPETVELMEWIKKSTPAGSVFAGSMQLLASVRLCTDRPITNHPHFEDKWLRQRTRQVYKIYSRVEPFEVHKTLKKDIGADYIILENSICFAESDGKCKLIDILDMKDGIVPEFGSPIPGLQHSATPRFCKLIQQLPDNYSQYFNEVFTNRLFSVFQML